MLPRTMDYQIQKSYWSIYEVGKELNEAPSALRFWLKEFNIEVRRNRRGDRKFTLEDKQKLAEIHYLLRVEKFTIIGAKQKLEGHD